MYGVIFLPKLSSKVEYGCLMHLLLMVKPEFKCGFGSNIGVFMYGVIFVPKQSSKVGCGFMMQVWIVTYAL